MKHIEQSVVFNDDDTVAVGVTLCLDEIDSFTNLLTLREIVICTVSKLYRHKVLKALQLGC